MRIYTTYKVKIKHYNHIFKDTVKIYRNAVDYLINVCLENWDSISMYKGQNRLTYVEALTHATKENPVTKYDFDVKFYKMPSYLHRGAINEAIGKVSSYISNLSNWKTNPVGREPSVPKAGYVFPSMYRTVMYNQTDDYIAQMENFTMKLYVKAAKENIYSGEELKVNDLSQILKVAENHPLCCISAITEANSLDDIARKRATSDLEGEIASSYDYVSIYGGWVDSNNEDTVEESFIVIGPKYKSMDEPFAISYNKRILADFKYNMVGLCRKFHQAAILIITYAEKEEELELSQSEIRQQLYRQFMNPNYIDKDNWESNRLNYDNESDMYEKLSDPEYEAVDFHNINGYWLNKSGNITNVFHNISSKQIGDYFSTIARDAGAQRFTLMSSTMIYSSAYIPRNQAYVNMVRTLSKSMSLKDRKKCIRAQKENAYYKKLNECKYNRYF